MAKLIEQTCAHNRNFTNHQYYNSALILSSGMSDNRFCKHIAVNAALFLISIHGSPQNHTGRAFQGQLRQDRELGRKFPAKV